MRGGFANATGLQDAARGISATFRGLVFCLGRKEDGAYREHAFDVPGECHGY